MRLWVISVARVKTVGGLEGRETPLAVGAFLERGARVGAMRVVCGKEPVEDGAEWVCRWYCSTTRPRLHRDTRYTYAARPVIMDVVDVVFIEVRRFVFPGVVGV